MITMAEEAMSECSSYSYNEDLNTSDEFQKVSTIAQII